MLCPNCPETRLTMTERQGVEIDYCPNCRGIWLDRGELDKLLDRAASQSPGAGAAAPQPVAPPPPQQQPYNYRRDNDDSKYGYQYGGKRKKSWLSEIFD
ncbi:MAG TPA: zf-TFIIB domain-containing protein [Tepidisphaeraceae bacterium]|jgi:hypothetical protein|nr:zf-TFIIB domain-containing protein [Tepidisphaeraceae bacterium]